MEKKNWFSGSNKIKIIVISMIIFATSIIGITYAYFGLDVIGNETASSVRLRTAKKSLVYTDVQIASGTDTFPGWTVTKTLTVENTGRSTVAYNIIWREIVNSISNNELVLTATCSSSSGSCSNITETPVVYAPETLTDKAIKKNISIAAGEIHTYQLTVTFKDTGSNQDYNQRKSITGTINIDDFDPSFTRVGTDSATGLPVVRSNTITSEEFYDITDVINYPNLISATGNLYNYENGKSILLAKYNLLVGDVISYYANENTYTFEETLTPSHNGYGLQNVEAKGYVYGESSMIVPYVGVVPFSGTNYWDNSVCEYSGTTCVCTGEEEYKSEYTENTENDAFPNVYNSSLSSVAPSINHTNGYGLAQNNGYTIAYYVEAYINRLEINGIGRLLTIDEHDSIEASGGTKYMATSNGTSYWLGSAYDYNGVWQEIAEGGTIGVRFALARLGGVRPVIVVDTADIESGS